MKMADIKKKKRLALQLTHEQITTFITSTSIKSFNINNTDELIILERNKYGTVENDFKFFEGSLH